ncbi:RNA 2',3'-cyclic phosphodiesterase [Yinghuangia sp. ASG 101]|uniref:RNA 2',3'-cyclic phosphodiesterase n=1 Tax=Yinghuangia sp. ASG 101 TaxID=2896848 RepID=UPI001E42E810|nr:RNA 2',3'-cyclic phosphodiesterase [Yinghuangia sp. ASG 101]UGQ12664.1 RNA 2',3'-cyclic phosphodiesterase [Yinghuangia sp. ASG 101]
MRLFVALTPPAEAAAELAGVVERVRGRYPVLRWTEPEAWHVTLVFLGEVGDDARAVLEPRLARVASRHPALALRVAGGGRFGDRVLWAGIETGHRAARDPGRTAHPPGDDAHAPGCTAHAVGRAAHAVGHDTDDPGRTASDPGRAAHAPGDDAHDSGHDTHAPGHDVHDSGRARHGARRGRARRALPALAVGARRAAAKSGIPVEERAWHAHLTLARVPRKPEREAREGAAALRHAVADLADLTGAWWAADRLRLVRSVAGAGPTRYEDVASWPLTGA